MIKYIPVILICSMTAPDKDCREDNTEVTVVKGEMQNTPMSCLMYGGGLLASLAFAPRVGEKFYARIKCDVKEIQ